MPQTRTSISIDAELMRRFQATYPERERSRVIQRLIERDLAEREDRFARCAAEFETHPDFQEAREDQARWEESTVGDGFSDEKA